MKIRNTCKYICPVFGQTLHYTLSNHIITNDLRFKMQLHFLNITPWPQTDLICRLLLYKEINEKFKFVV